MNLSMPLEVFIDEKLNWKVHISLSTMTICTDCWNHIQNYALHL